ncbi:COPII coat assembly protein SEC16 [Xylariales sp. AK1849]|nr:COPII coat assembly protein SEC16 [Xylariales sp. AK1849]
MASDTLSASWHPAMMPNSRADLRLDEPAQDSQPQQRAPTLEDKHTQEPEDTSSHEIPHDTTAAEATNDGAFVNQLTHDDSEEGGWDLSHEGTQEVPTAQEAAIESNTFAVEEASIAAPQPVLSTKAAKHSSTVSFARTVSHDVNWGDDEEDPEWNLERSETDPFNFMPPNDRTNSFPAVPPVEPAEEELLDQPPPATQVQDILQEIEHEDNQLLKTSGSWEEGDADEEDQIGDSSFQQSVGGEMFGTAEDASDARFEEGLPLIPQNELQTGADTEASHPSALDDSFPNKGEEGGDDFFSQIPGAATQEPEAFDLSHTLQRKDTGMFVATAVNPAAPVHVIEPETSMIPEAVDTEAELPTTGTGEVVTASDQNKIDEPKDLDDKWAAAFAGDEDEDFLLDESAAVTKDLDPTDFFGSDDEGFLEDTEDAAVPAQHHISQPTPTATAPVPSASMNGRYAPTHLPAQTQPLLNTFNSLPAVPQAQQYGPSTMTPPVAFGYGTPPPVKPETSTAQSFVKAKGGYSSPYDLPMDVFKPPKKRVSMQQIPRANTNLSAPPVAPPRASSIYNQPTPPSGATSTHSQPPPPLGASVSSLSPPSSSHSNHQQPPGLKPMPQLKSKSSFFEDLPISSKPRPASRQNSLPSPQQNTYSHPSQSAHQGPPQGPPLASPSLQSPLASPPSQQPPPGVASLIAPDRTSPYAQLQANSQAKPSPPLGNKYSPAPSQGSMTNGVPSGQAASSRYSPAPPSRSHSGGYSAVPPPVLAHQPRTSSPLAHFEVSRAQHKLPSPGEAPLPARSNSLQYEPRLTRVPSLPSTKEVEEEGGQPLLQSPPPMSRTMSAMQPAESRYSPQQARRSPPPTGPLTSSTLSPPKRPTSNYAPLPQTTGAPKEVNFAPPARSQTQSPSALYGNRSIVKPVDPIPRPSSVQGPTSPRAISNSETSPTVTRARGMSQALTLIPPTDGRELDPLQRWRGAPLISWGVGGTIVTSFPKDVPRYGMNQALPMIIRSPGEVKMKHVKDVQPPEERLTKFPGPLKGKSKKKETIAWLTQGIDSLESGLPNVAFSQFVSHEDKRAIERVLLWKILRVFVEFDGVLEGNANVEKAVRQVLSPELDGDGHEPTSALSAGSGFQGGPSRVTGMQSDAVDSSAIEEIRKHLLLGDREKAVWAAVDKRLWGHAMLISNTVQGDLYKQVSQEFIRKEVNHASRSNESLAALYGVLSGNLEESVDELVPSHARAGLQLMSTSASATNSTDTLAGLDKWRETLGMILSNRSNSDIVAITSLGNLLSGYGRAEAAHICFIFARQHAVFGGLDDSKANFVLVGADHRRQADQFAKEIEALLLSEVYEYGLSLSGGSNVPQSCPHLAAYKLQHAMTLAEYGSRDKALQYCDAIMNAITAQTKRSPYYHPILETSVDDLSRRLKLSPREGSNSWIPKPTMNQVSSSMWNKFNKFVAGDDNESSGPGSPGEPGTESGPFARIAGGTPTISRSPSVNNFDVYGNGGPSPTLPVTQAASRYAPLSGQPSTSPYNSGSTYAPRASMERSSSEYQRSSYELPRPAVESTPMYGGSVGSNSVATFGYQPVPNAAPQASQYSPSPQGSAPIPIPQPPSNSYSPYQSYGAQTSSQSLHAPAAASSNPEIAVHDVSTESGYQHPSRGYEPLSMSSFDAPVSQSTSQPTSQPEEPPPSGGGYEAPSYQPYSYEPPSTSYETPAEDGDAELEKPRKKSFMDDDDDDFQSAKKPAEKSKTDKDRENQEMFRKAAEEDAKRAEAAKAQKKGWFSGGWFGGGAKKESGEMSQASNKPIRAKLGESSSFIYDPNQGRWVNKKSGAENTPAKTATPPPPRGTPPPGPGPSSAPPPMSGLAVGPPPPMGMPKSMSNLRSMSSMDSIAPPKPAMGGTSPTSRSVSNMSNVSSAAGDSTGPPSNLPSRPATSLSNASSIDDLLGAAGPRKAGAKKGRKSGRYVDVMAK